MKRILVLFGILSSAVFAPAQWGWSDAVPITDSLHFNRNLSIATGWNISGEGLYAAWEESDDTLSTAIWCRNIQTMTDPFLALGSPGIHYRNPKVYQVLSGDTLFYLYYETYQAGSWDIMYVGYLGNGNFSDPIPFCSTPNDDGSFIYENNRAVWVSGGDIFEAPYQIPGGFTSGCQVYVIDTGGCRNPAFNGNIIAWEKTDGNDVRIWASYYQISGFSTPEPIAEQGLNEHLTLGAGLQGNELLWQSLSNGIWEISGTTLPGNNPLEIPGLDGYNNILPEYSYMIIGDEKDYPFIPGMLTFASDSSGNYEIYAFEEYWYPYFVNLSQFPLTDLNPSIFVVFNLEPGHGNLILTWESNRNGNWQIWMRNQDIYAADPDEHAIKKGSGIQVIPNPMTTSTTFLIPIDRSGPYRLSVVSVSGQTVKSFSGLSNQSGPLEIKWDGHNDHGVICPNGIYLVTASDGSGFFHGVVTINR